MRVMFLAVASAQLAPMRLPNSTFELGVVAFGDVAPVSTLTVPNDSHQRQMSVYTGVRLLTALPLGGPWRLAFGAE